MPLSPNEEFLLLTVLYETKELFGPKVLAEILDVTDAVSLDRGPPRHLFGDLIWDQNDAGSIPGQALLAALTGAGSHGVNLDQSPFRSFGRVLRLDLASTCVAIVVSAEQFAHPDNSEIFRRFRNHVASFVLGADPRPPHEQYLTTLLPAWLHSSFAWLLPHIRRLSGQRVEQRELSAGFILTSDYSLLKLALRGARFVDTQGPPFRDIERIRQPFLGVADGRESFVVVDFSSPDPSVCGIAFLGPCPNGVFSTTGSLAVTPNGVVLQFQGGRFARLASHVGQVEIVDGSIRARDPGARPGLLVEALSTWGLPGLAGQVAEELLRVGERRKGALFVIGPRLPGTAWRGGVSCTVPLTVAGQLLPGPLVDLSATDGAVLIDEGSLELYQFGAVLQLSDTSGALTFDSSAGSRSQAAQRFSHDHPGHLVIKVSVDGPIAVFASGRRSFEV